MESYKGSVLSQGREAGFKLLESDIYGFIHVEETLLRLRRQIVGNPAKKNK
jgi:hypothetical protein